jgi:hypothetical protein
MAGNHSLCQVVRPGRQMKAALRAALLVEAIAAEFRSNN